MSRAERIASIAAGLALGLVVIVLLLVLFDDSSLEGSQRQGSGEAPPARKAPQDRPRPDRG